jgi:hypothetical protein
LSIKAFQLRVLDVLLDTCRFQIRFFLVNEGLC